MAFDMFHHVKDVFQVEQMTFAQLKYWHKYHVLIAKEE